MNATPPAWPHRLAAAACYLGMAPAVRLWRAASGSPFVEHHLRQSMAALFAGWVVLLSALGGFEVGLSAFLIWFPKAAAQLAERWSWLGAWLGDAVGLALVGLAALWLAFLSLAFAGSNWAMPGLTALSRKDWVVRCAFRANVLTWLALPVLLVFGLYASASTTRAREGAAVYFLYDEGIPVPRWGYAMGLSRIARRAQRHWGPHCTVLDHLTLATLRTALASGKIVILATHGGDGYAGTYCAPQTLIVGPPPLGVTDQLGQRRFLQTSILPYEWESWKRLREGTWDRWENVRVGSQVQLVYLFACDGGKKAAEWQEHLAPARVVSYNRLSAVWDHAWWFAVTGPAQVESLK